MEALDASSRPSGILSIINREKVDRIDTNQVYTSASNMAALVSPTSMYSNNGPPPPPPYSTGWPAPPTHPISGLISPPESRRTSDNKAEPPPPIQTAPPQHRQSLPSIREALDSAPKPNPYASPVSASLAPSHHQLPYSQGPNVPRSYPPESATSAAQYAPAQPRHPSPPQPIHANPFSRPEAVPASFAEARQSSLSSLQTAPGPPPNPYAGRPYEPTRYDREPRAPEPMSNGYHPQQQGAYTYGPGPQIPQAGHHPSFTEPRYAPRDMREPMDGWKGREEDKLVGGVPPFQQGLKRHLEVWDFENNLAQIDVSSSTLQEWSRNYHRISQEQQRTIPDRMPTIESCEEMLMNNQKIMYALQRMKETIRQQEYAIADQRMRDYGPKGPGDYDDEMSMYGDDLKNQGFGGSESKKRRGRAAPPGRCHSCNRAETPEWRRGPDGARTLCNACGLHYAKLTRKQSMKQSQGSNGSSLRPKSMDDHSPRP